jgi:hypothetical protein
VEASLVGGCGGERLRDASAADVGGDQDHTYIVKDILATDVKHGSSEIRVRKLHGIVGGP